MGTRVVQFVAINNGPFQPPGEHHFVLMDDGRLFERYVYTGIEPGPWVEIFPPNGNSPNVPVVP